MSAAVERGEHSSPVNGSMPQKKASSSGGPPAAKGKAKAKACHGTSLLEQTEDTAQAGQRERKRVRNLEEQVSKVLRDNFRGVPTSRWT